MARLFHTFRNAAITAGALDAIVTVNVDGLIESVNPATEQMFGYSSGELLGRPLTMLIPPELRAAHEAGFSSYLHTGVARMLGSTVELLALHKSGVLIPVEVSISEIAVGPIRLFCGVLRDIRQRQLIQRELQRQSNQDALTGLANRSYFLHHLQQHVAALAGGEHFSLLLFIDLDHFKFINDSQGHEAGDRVLCGVARLLRDWVREGDMVARLGGDEFVVLLSSLSSVREGEIICARLLAHLSGSALLGSAGLYVTASIGIAVYPRDACDANGLLQCADMAMYRAKQEGRNNYRFYSQELEHKTQQFESLRNELHHALEQGELYVVYQPQFDCAGQLSGVEALLRWLHPQQGLIPPERFIAVAEQSGLIARLGTLALSRALAEWRVWQRQLLNGYPLRLSVNVSVFQLYQPELVQHLLEQIEDSGVPPQLVELEVTESVLIEGMSHCIDALDELARHGVRLSIDDFGTGYASFRHLRLIPARSLKIDRSFIVELGTRPEADAIVEAMIAMAHSLGLTVIAEGVETAEQLQALRRLRCDHVQGFLLSLPLDGAAMAALIAERLGASAGDEAGPPQPV